ncbi:ankyrin repeat domain-containing protein [Kiritimatiellaeota bacterium B1221]|nr:ankyrin repeat domain-containing protein [Kiritimatiellaeota bacterium B1221]
MQRQVSQGVAIDSKGRKGWPILVCAIEQGHLDVARWLVREGAEVNIVTDFGSCPLTFAVLIGDIDFLKELLRNGADPNLYRGYSSTPLIMACSRGNFPAVKLLVEHGALVDLANVYPRDLWYASPLRSAVSKGSQEIVNYLLDQGASINAKQIQVNAGSSGKAIKIKHGFTPLMQAAWELRDDVEMVRLLVERGADISITSNGESAVDHARERGNRKVAAYLAGRKLKP